MTQPRASTSGVDCLIGWLATMGVLISFGMWLGTELGKWSVWAGF